ncbi:hypothetical protein PspLS_01563 [Pyricularia sp. CBS 133598]|nr:hypothetical protein PspLS_01565 [Pyricularia sp. CBS 133598]TLD34246.1 hypothetical protein PspLS_01563 [Pyricularia sp. CBS 133598]
MRFSTLFVPFTLAVLEFRGVSAGGDDTIGSTIPQRPASPADSGAFLAAGSSAGSRKIPDPGHPLPEEHTGLLGWGPAQPTRKKQKFPRPDFALGPSGTDDTAGKRWCKVSLVRAHGSSNSWTIPAGEPSKFTYYIATDWINEVIITPSYQTCKPIRIEGKPIPDGWKWKWRRVPNPCGQAGNNDVATAPLVARDISENWVAEVKRAVEGGSEAELLRRQGGPSPNTGHTCKGTDGSPGVCDQFDVCRRRRTNPGRGSTQVIGSCPR